MDNYWLKRYIGERELNWDRNRIETLESLIRETTYFVLDVGSFIPNPSLLDEGEVVDQCIKEIYDQEKAKSWIYMHLYGHAVRQANAIGILIEESCIQSGLQLWRSLFEAYVICEFFAIHCSESPQIFRDYISHSLLRSWIRSKENYNNICKEKGKEPCYDESEICYMKEIFKCKFGSLNKDYSWARSIFEDIPNFINILDRVDSDMEIFYHLSSKEIHPTIGHRFVLAGLRLPLPMIPMMPINDVFNMEEMFLDYLTAKPLVQITSRISDFLILDDSLLKRLESLTKLGDDVLRKLAKEMPSDS